MDDERQQKQRKRERERIMGGVTERKEKNRGAEKTCQYIKPGHSGKPSEDKAKDLRKRKRPSHRRSLFD